MNQPFLLPLRALIGPPYIPLRRREFGRETLFLFGVRGLALVLLNRLLPDRFAGTHPLGKPPGWVSTVVLLFLAAFAIPYIRLLYGRLVHLGFALPRLATCLLCGLTLMILGGLSPDFLLQDLAGLGLSAVPFLALLLWPDHPSHAPEPRHPTADMIATTCFLSLLFI